MKYDFYHKTVENVQKWRQEKPTWFALGGISLGLLVYYLLVVGSLDYTVDNLQKAIAVEQTQAEWMTKAGQEILRLRQSAPNHRVKNSESAFNLVNQSINTQGWSKLVTDVHQIEQNRVQVNFNAIAFKELMAWLEALFSTSGIHVVEANLTKSQVGVVSATLVLQQNQ